MSFHHSVRAGRTALVVGLTSLAALTGAITAAGSAHAATPAKPTVVLVHGAWADGSSWDGVVKVLQRRGYTVDVPANPLRGLASDTAYLKDYLTSVKGPIVLVGHSYGGAVITDAATGNPQVKALVYVDAFIPAEGESLLSILTPPKGSNQPGLDPKALFDFVPFPGAPSGVSDLYMKPSVFHGALANDLSAGESAVLASTQRPIASSALTEKSTAPAWKAIPSWDVIGTEDHVIPAALQESMAKRAGSHVTEIRASHLSLISHPDVVANVVLAAAQHVG